ncbi:MAG TPA: glycosyltransferase family 4 protein [Cyclobacteriaceae bacterium]|jgi:glycosyltransferase involved in cell wall biosynthesis|nr:glycosyltransferase family 4 protein [Cyclobacteriaceae bacterium]
MKIFFLVPYPLAQSPSQRFRFEQYFEVLKDQGMQCKVQSFLSHDNWRVFYNKGNNLLKLRCILAGFIKRAVSLFAVLRYDFVFIHREATPIGPPIFEWVIAKLLRKKMIYDFDDAIWLTDKKRESRMENIIRWRGKVAHICKWSFKVSAGNAYLADYAKTFNKNVVVNPTTIDTVNVHKTNSKFQANQRIVIGWTGSHSTLKYLKDIEGILMHIEQRFLSVDFCVIADKAPDLNLKRLVFKPWSLETEVGDLTQFDIGVMPLPDDEWAKGKCGFKALQYMAMEIPTVASPVGVNTEIIKNGINGLLARNPAEWEKSLSVLIDDENLRKRLGKEGRLTVEQHYSVNSNKKNFRGLFDV